MLKKLGLVSIGVTAGLVAVAPLASATESHHDSHHDDSSNCNVTAGDAEANGGVRGNPALGNTLTQAPVGGDNLGNIVCNDILNGNLSGNTFSLGEDEETVVDEEPSTEAPTTAAPPAEAPTDAAPAADGASLDESTLGETNDVASAQVIDLPA